MDVHPRVCQKVSEVTTAYAQAPSFQKMATQMGIIDFHQFLPQLFQRKISTSNRFCGCADCFSFQNTVTFATMQRWPVHTTSFARKQFWWISCTSKFYILRWASAQSYWPTLSCRTTGKDLSSFEESQSICTVWQVRRACEDKGESGVWKRSLRNAGLPFPECMGRRSPRIRKSLCWVNSCWAVCCWPRFSPLARELKLKESEVWHDHGASFGKRLNGLWDAMNSLKIYWCWFFGVWFSNLISGIAAASYHSPSITLGKFRLRMLFPWVMCHRKTSKDGGGVLG